MRVLGKICGYSEIEDCVQSWRGFRGYDCSQNQNHWLCLLPCVSLRVSPGGLIS